MLELFSMHICIDMLIWCINKINIPYKKNIKQRLNKANKYLLEGAVASFKRPYIDVNKDTGNGGQGEGG